VSGTYNVKCACVEGKTGCSKKFLWKASGEGLQTWYQDAELMASRAEDISAACYRKRDVDGLGDGLCCTVSTKPGGTPDPAELHAFFGALSVVKKASSGDGDPSRVPQGHF
jgi:hypothetical protein